MFEFEFEFEYKPSCPNVSRIVFSLVFEWYDQSMTKNYINAGIQIAYKKCTFWSFSVWFSDVPDEI